jgi:LysR family cys regulon transcriptional activator
VPRDHPLTLLSELTLEDVAAHPIVTYVFGFTGRSKLVEAFLARGLVPKVVFTAADADVIKTYVRLGLGIGIVAAMAYDERADADLVALDATRLVANHGSLRCWGGGGIVADSEAEQEYQETYDKVGRFLSALEQRFR